MALDPGKFRVTGDTEFTPELWNRVMEQIALAIVEIQEKATSFDDASKQLIQTALFRINEALAPAFELVLDYQTGGFLTAPIAENSEVTFETGNGTLAIDPAKRALFRPSPFIALTRASTTADVAIAQALGYDPETGALEYTVHSVTGSAGPHDDVIVAAVAGSVQAQMQFLTETKAARDLAKDWASKAPDTDVTTPGTRSAFSRAAEAAFHASAAATQAGIATTKAGEAATSKTGADNAKTAAEAARDAALAAQSAAEAAADEAATFDPDDYLTETETNAAIAAAIDALLDGAPGALNTLNELAAALGDDANFATSVTSALAGKAAASHTHTLAALTDVAAASVTELLAGTANKLVLAAIVKDATTWLALTDASTVAIDWSLRAAFEVTLQGNREIGSPTNVVAGQTRYLLLKGNNSTDRAPTFGSNYKGDLPSISDVDDTRWYLLTLVAVATDHIAVASMRALGS